MDAQGLGKVLLMTGIVFAGVGAALLFADKIPFLGKLPGDISIKREGFQIHIPLMTSIVLSVLVSVILWLISHWKK